MLLVATPPEGPLTRSAWRALPVRARSPAKVGLATWRVTRGGDCAATRRLGHRFVAVRCEPAWCTRRGFEPASRHGLRNEHGAGDGFMVLPLHPAELPPKGSLIRYRAEFAAMDTQEGQP